MVVYGSFWKNQLALKIISLDSKFIGESESICMSEKYTDFVIF